MRRSFAGLITLSVILLFILVQACNRDQGSTSKSNQGQAEPTFTDAQSAANQSLATFRKLVNAQNYKELGFESPEEVANAALGAPLRTSMVKLEQLKAYKAGDDANRLLSEIDQVYYPVIVQNQVRSAISVEQSNGKWRATGFGPANFAKQIDRARKAGNAAPDAQQILVHVAPFNLYFVGRRVENKLMLTPAGDYQSFNLKAGATLPAEEVFATLATFAQQYNGLPM
ncbi:MAG: putative secreted protein [Acidobacteria bacterium]|nr:putative secreted protein [Acidobacteriota bacterium]